MTFEWPMMLFGLALVPLLAALYALAQRRRRTYAARFTNLALLRQVAGRSPGWRRHMPPLLSLLGLAALLVGLARPSAVVLVPRDQAAVMLVVDTSGSMAASDLQPDRMTAARAAARAFVGALPERLQAGVVSFNTSASVVAPLGRDRPVATRAIDGLIAGGGTAIGDGLWAALDGLGARPADATGMRPPATVILLSDGASSAGRPPERAAARAKEEGVRVHTVGIGQRGASPRIGEGRAVPLDEGTLRAVAAATGGEYFYAAEAGELERIYADLGAQVSWVEEYTEITALVGALAAAFAVAAGLLGLLWFQQFP